MRRLLPLVPLTLVATLLSAAPVAVTAPAAAAPARAISYTAWDTPEQLRAGRLDGTRVTRGTLVATKEPAARVAYAGGQYDAARWFSPWTEPGFALTELVSSWSATTTGDSLVEVAVRGRTSGRRSSWDVLGRWTSGDEHTRRTSVADQGDDLADVSIDTWRAPGGLTSYQVRVTLLRRTGTSARAVVDTVGAMASRLPDVDDVATSKPGVARGVVLDVPRYSQMVHEGHSPQWGGGGEAWCSPTSTSMVLAYYDALPPASDWAWVGAGHQDPMVDHAARMTYDAAYRGTGNWPFNTAYAAPLAGNAFVTRLRSLREAERFVKAGIPLIASISFGRGELSGAPISASNGHLLVIAGFTASGDVVVNDPAAPRNSGVRRTYDRGQFEDAWLPTSGGLVYVVHDDEHPLPASSGSW